MKDCNKNFLDEVLKYPTEGEDDNDIGLIDLDQVLNTNVGSDYEKVEPTETEEQKAARIAKEEADKNKEKEEGEEEREEENELDNLSLLQGLVADELTDDQKELKKEILSKFKGESIDDKGNILDKDGKIVADFKKVDDYINAEPILDKDGNQVDEDGKIIRTKAQVQFEKSAIGGVVADLPYELKDEKGNPIIYEDTLEGYTKLAKDIASIELEKYKQSFFESNPTLREVSKHLLSGGKLEDFNNPIDYSKIDTKKLSVNDKLDLIKKSFIVSGVDSDNASDILDLIKEKGDTEIDKRLTKAISTLDNNQKEIQNQRDTAYQKSIDDENNKIVEYWGQVKQTIDKGKFGNVEIPKEDQEAFFKYLAIPVDDEGNSQESIDNRKQGLESDLMMRYYRFKGYNLDKIVNKEKNKDKVLTLRERINKAHKSNSFSSSSSSSSKKTTNPGDVSLDELLSE